MYEWVANDKHIFHRMFTQKCINLSIFGLVLRSIVTDPTNIHIVYRVAPWRLR